MEKTLTLPSGTITGAARHAYGWGAIMRAVYRARIAIISAAVVQVLGVLIGTLMVHTGSTYALVYGDKLVARAQKQDAAAISYRHGDRLPAAIKDFGMNLFVGAVPQTITGLTVVSPYAFGAYRGWVGGIVSVDRNHKSRFLPWRRGAYYLIALVLQLIPYSLAGGIGVQLGLSFFRRFDYYGEERIHDYPKEAIRDVVRVYELVVPLFFIASLWEFLSPWN